MEIYKLTYTGKEIEKKFDKVEIYNFIGKFTDNSTESDWFCKLNEQKVNINVNSETKEFKEIIEEIISFKYLFYGNKKLISLNILDVPNITNMQYAFYSCDLLNTLDLSKFDTSNITDMSYIFGYCRKLTNLNLSNFNTSNVTNMHEMFIYCYGLTTLDLSKFDTSNVIDMSNMFKYCHGLTILDLSKFDTSNVIDMSQMFADCYVLTTLNLSNFNTSNVTNMNDMFKNCDSLSYIKCKQSFKDWCIQNQDIIKLPDSMREGGSGTWDIIDAA